MKRRLIALVMLLAMALTLAGCGKSAAVKETERLIQEIGTVTADSKTAVEAAEAAYQALSEEEQKAVANYDTLTAARESLDAAVQEVLRQSMLGTWQMELDARDDLVAELDAQFSGMDKSFGDYLESYTIKMDLELKEDGTYHMIGDADSVETSFNNLRAATKAFTGDFLVKYIADYLKSMGVEGDFSTREGLEAAMGQDLDSAIEDTLHMSLDEYVDQMMGELNVEETVSQTEIQGQYKVESGKLYLSEAADQAINESNYVTFTVDGDTMTWTDATGEVPVNFDETVVFTRIG